jgi:hypothetical protein
MYIKTSDQEILQLGIGNYSCNWGMHVCGLYETEEERDEIIFGFLSQGCKDGDMQLYYPGERSVEDFCQKFSSTCPDCKAHLHDPDYFVLAPAKEVYTPQGVFDPWEMEKALNKYYTASQANGRRNVRATSEMVWALDPVPGIENLLAYESRTNYFITGKHWIGICMYNVTKFSGALIMNVLRTHPFSLNGSVITANPYYENPDIWLAKHAPQFLNANK